MSNLITAEGEFLSIDYGLKRVGLARINSHAQIAEYLPTIQREDDQQVIEEVLVIAKDLNAHGIVVGLPRDMNGNTTEQTKLTEKFTVELAKNSKVFGLQVYSIDEALSSEAAREAGDIGLAGVDSVAAGIIAEDFIKYKSPQKLLVRAKKYSRQADPSNEDEE